MNLRLATALGMVWLLDGGCARERPAAPATTAAAPAAAKPALRLPEAHHGTGAIEGEQPEYDQQRQPDRVMAELQIKPGQTVADLGAGRGYFTLRFAAAVGPTGRVVATDIDDAALQTLRLRTQGLPNVVVRAAQPDDPGLEPGQYDLIWMSEMDHFLDEHRAEYLAKLRAALKPNGRLAVTHVRALQPPLMAAAAAAGYSLVREVTTLPRHYLVFLQPTMSASAP